MQSKLCQEAHGGDEVPLWCHSEGLRALPRACCPQQRPPPRRAGPRHSPCSRWRSWHSGATRRSRTWCHKGPVDTTAGKTGLRRSLLHPRAHTQLIILPGPLGWTHSAMGGSLAKLLQRERFCWGNTKLPCPTAETAQHFLKSTKLPAGLNDWNSR